jgi:hypothetical protein
MVSLTFYASDPPSPVVQSWAVGRTDGALHDPRETKDAWNAAHVAAPCGTRLFVTVFTRDHPVLDVSCAQAQKFSCPARTARGVSPSTFLISRQR